MMHMAYSKQAVSGMRHASLMDLSNQAPSDRSEDESWLPLCLRLMLSASRRKNPVSTGRKSPRTAKAIDIKTQTSTQLIRSAGPPRYSPLRAATAVMQATRWLVCQHLSANLSIRELCRSGFICLFCYWIIISVQIYILNISPQIFGNFFIDPIEKTFPLFHNRGNAQSNKHIMFMLDVQIYV